MKLFDGIITQANMVKYKPVLSVLEYYENCYPGQFCRLQKNGELLYGYITNHPNSPPSDTSCMESSKADIHCFLLVDEARSPYYLTNGKGVNSHRWIIIEIEDESDLSVFKNRMRLIEDMSLRRDSAVTRLVHSAHSKSKKEEKNL